MPKKTTNTLFNYFTKSPPPAAGLGQKVLRPKRSPNSPRTGGRQQQQQPDRAGSGGGVHRKKTCSQNGDSTTAAAAEFTPGDVVWAKFGGHPWWPSLVCDHPMEKRHFRSGKTPEVHVQFLDDPPSRSWVKAKFVKPFQGSGVADVQQGGVFFSSNASRRKSAAEADKVLKMGREDRLNLIVELQPSDDDEEGDDDTMNFDSDIFDDEIDENDNGKENQGLEDAERVEKQKAAKKVLRRSQNKTKRRRIIVAYDSNEDSGEEYKVSDDESESEASSGVDEEDVSASDKSEPESPVKSTRKRKRSRYSAKGNKESSPESGQSKPSSFQSVISSQTKSKLALFSSQDTVQSPSGCSRLEGEASFSHLSCRFLKPDEIKDINGRSKTHPEYDPRTLQVPEAFKKTLSPAMYQWWDIKSKHFDTVLFFKVGKFYELYHMDAVTCVNELGLVFARGVHAHAGFPEIAYGRFADTLIRKGYKVARIEQTETPEMMNERCRLLARPATKFDKVVRRELCRITSKGTKTYNFMEGDTCEAQNAYLFAVTEKEENGCCMYGVCFVDTSIGKFHVGQLADDRHCSRLRTAIAHHTPSQILFERGKLSHKTMQVINNTLGSALKEGLTSGTEFWDSSKTLRMLAEGQYFKDKAGEFAWPPPLTSMMGECDTLGLSAADEYQLGISALGGIVWYLKHCKLDHELLSMKNFEEYKPLDDVGAKVSSSPGYFDGRKRMVLDGVTLSNLDITDNSATGTTEGTLLERLDQCCTSFGKRLFRQWLCAPLCNPSSINDRLDAVDDLIQLPDIMADVTEMLKKLPDLSRLLSRIHSLGVSNKGRNHPDSRAILYEDVTYSKRKIEDFISALDGFKSAMTIIRLFEKTMTKFRSKLLRQTASMKNSENPDGRFPDLSEELEYFQNAFDHKKAKKEGVILPCKGVDPEYDEALHDVMATENKLDAYLEKQRERLGCKTIVYWGSAKNRYQMEVPESHLSRVPNEYNAMSSKKGWKRYRTVEIEKLLSKLTDAEERRDSLLKDTMRQIFHTFDEKRKLWADAVECLSVLDVLLCLAQYSRCEDGIICRPEICSLDSDTKPFLEIRDGRHPCIFRTFAAEDFIPNDTTIGVADVDEMEVNDLLGRDSKLVLVTGPNMGGKSTLMRQVGLIVVMAQMGCYVPAQKCCLTPIDRVFTRLGASDRIMTGESTFFVELSETSAILQHATQHSLVLMDELGRGTATFDGTAIAAAVVQELSQTIGCRTLFSTHYHSLVEEFSHDPNVRLGHMACMVENENEDDPTQETITFLYKFIKGACPKSYGFNAARLASIPDEIIKVAVKKAHELEKNIKKIQLMKSLWMEDAQDKQMQLQQQIAAV